MRADIVRYVFAVWTVLMCAMITAPAASAERDVKLIKKDGTYKGTISSEYITPTDGFVKDIELSFVWSAIFDQPIEYYVFKWNRNPSYTWWEDRTSYSRRQLEKYPDLLKRFDDLRPGNVELRLSLEFKSSRVYTAINNGQCTQSIINDNVICGYALSKTLTEIPNLMVVKSGGLGDNITPTSPKDDWAGFFDTSRMVGDKEAINEELHALMKRSKKIQVRYLELAGYTLPEIQLSHIFKDYIKRERKEDEKNDEASDTGTDAKKEEIDDDFWAGNDPAPSKTEQSGDSFWDGDDSASLRRNNSDDGFWEGGSGAPSLGANDKIIIESNGVKTSSGKILIPYKSWNVLSYKDGMAKVLIEKQRTPIFTIKSCGSVTTYDQEQGYIDSQGSWVIAPKKSIRTSIYEYPGPVYLTYCTIDPSTGRCPERRKSSAPRAAPQLSCKQKLRNEVKEIKSGYN